MNHFQAVLVGNQGLGPTGSRDDASVEFDGDAVAFERQLGDNLL